MNTKGEHSSSQNLTHDVGTLVASLAHSSLDDTQIDPVAQELSYQYWSSSCLNYEDKLGDGFYEVHGEFPETGTSIHEFPSLFALKSIIPKPNRRREVLLFDRRIDHALNNLVEQARHTVNEALALPSSSDVTAYRALSHVVAGHLGGPQSSKSQALDRWAKLINQIKLDRGSVVFPIGTMYLGAARHRAILYKYLADQLNLPARVVKGKFYAEDDDDARVIVQVDDREMLVDLMSRPGSIFPLVEKLAMRASYRENRSASLAEALSGSLAAAAVAAATGQGSGASIKSQSSADNHAGESGNRGNRIDSDKEGQLSLEQAMQLAAAAALGAPSMNSHGTAALKQQDHNPQEQHMSFQERTWATEISERLSGTSSIPFSSSSRSKLLPSPHESTASAFHQNVVPSAVGLSIGNAFGSLMHSNATTSTTAATTNAAAATQQHDHFLSRMRSRTSTEYDEPLRKSVGAGSEPDMYQIGPPALVSDSSGQQYIVQPVRSSMDMGAVPRSSFDYGSMQEGGDTAIDHDIAPPWDGRPRSYAGPIDVGKLYLDGLKTFGSIRQSVPLEYEQRQALLSRQAAAEFAKQENTGQFVRSNSPPPADMRPGSRSSGDKLPLPAPEIPLADTHSCHRVFSIDDNGPIHSPFSDAPAVLPLSSEASLSSEALSNSSSKKAASRVHSSSQKPAHEHPKDSVSPLISPTESPDSKLARTRPNSAMSEMSPAMSRGVSLSSFSIGSEDDIWVIDADELELGPRIGIGSYGEVYRGQWRQTDVAVKLLFDQSIDKRTVDGFCQEVSLMKRLHHPNILQFMGACSHPPNLCIVTEFMPRGSLFKLLHRSGNVHLDDKRKCQMALDIARGMNYLHTCRPPIIHRDLKSPNLLVDKDLTVKLCDFGLSRVRRAAILSASSRVGTPEWTAPEVLRGQACNESSDIYSYGVILWELFTEQEPWSDKTAMQVVGCVGFGNERLLLPDTLKPRKMRELIERCFDRAEERPSFSEIITIVKRQLQEIILVSTSNGT